MCMYLLYNSQSFPVEFAHMDGAQGKNINVEIIVFEIMLRTKECNGSVSKEWIKKR